MVMIKNYRQKLYALYSSKHNLNVWHHPESKSFRLSIKVSRIDKEANQKSVLIKALRQKNRIATRLWYWINLVNKKVKKKENKRQIAAKI